MTHSLAKAGRAPHRAAVPRPFADGFFAPASPAPLTSLTPFLHASPLPDASCFPCGLQCGRAPRLRHPRNKQTVGHRLARLALADVYQQKVAANAPVLDKHWIKDGEIHLSFKNADGGLVARDDPVTGCVITGADRLWHPATARIEGDRLVLSSPAVPAPVAARYGWANNPACNLYNRADLPLAPFRTDSWQ